MADWISVDDRLPEPFLMVLIRQKTGYKDNSVTVLGQWIPRFSQESGPDDDDWTEYSEEKDEFYVPEGWYESQVNWGEYANIHVSEEVTHWQPLPAPPENKE